MMYQIAKTKRITEGIKIPSEKPHLAIRAVYLVPANCEKVRSQKIIRTPKNLMTGTWLRAGQLKTNDSAPKMK